MDKEKLVKLIVIFITLLIAYFLMTQISLSMLLKTLISVSPVALAASFILYGLMNAFRSIRYSMMIGRSWHPGFIGMFNIVCTHNIANNLFPMRTGELTFVYLVKARLNVATGVGAVTVVLSRIYDVLTICLLTVATILLFPGNYGMINRVMSYIAFVALVMFLMILLFVFYNRLFIIAIDYAYSKINRSIVLYIKNKMAEVAEFYSGPGYLAGIIPQLLVSILIWLFNVTSVYILAVSLGLTIDVWAIVIGIMFVVITASIPVQGIANLGSFELIWSFIFMALSVPKEIAISSGFAIHILILVFATLWWLFTIALGRFTGKYGPASNFSTSR